MKWLLLLLAACGDLQGFGGTVPPLATVELQVTGDASLLPADVDLHIAMVWGRQWLVEPLCILPPENDDAAKLIAAGCRDPFGFVAASVDSNLAVAPGVPETLDLFSLPNADVLVGELTARVGYASLIVYDDRDHSGGLELGRPNRLSGGGPPMMGNDLPTNLHDVVYGASFVTMTAPDQRIGFRQGEFSPVAAFYPRAGCGDPPSGFSALAAGGFTAQSAIDATLAGTLPLEDPATCAQTTLAATTLTIPIQAPANVSELACSERTTDSSVRYREPNADSPDLTNRVSACVHSPSFGAPSSTIEFIVSGRSDDSCVGLTHYILKGCNESPDCGSPDWNDAPPDWWPCGT